MPFKDVHRIITYKNLDSLQKKQCFAGFMTLVLVNQINNILQSLDNLKPIIIGIL
jgi:hypothetical protein